MSFYARINVPAKLLWEKDRADESCIAGVDSIIPLVHASISDPWGDILFHEVKNCEAYQRRGGGPLGSVMNSLYFGSVISIFNERVESIGQYWDYKSDILNAQNVTLLEKCTILVDQKWQCWNTKCPDSMFVTFMWVFHFWDFLALYI